MTATGVPTTDTPASLKIAAEELARAVERIIVRSRRIHANTIYLALHHLADHLLNESLPSPSVASLDDHHFFTAQMTEDDYQAYMEPRRGLRSTPLRGDIVVAMNGAFLTISNDDYLQSNARDNAYIVTGPAKETLVVRRNPSLSGIFKRPMWSELPPLT